MREHTVEWYVKINSSFYSVSYLGAGEGWKLVQIEGRRPGATYHIHLKDGQASCSCPDGISSRRCKHARAFQALGDVIKKEEPAPAGSNGRPVAL